MDSSIHITGRKAGIAPGLSVQRVLPSAQRRTVGPFIFFDHFGPAMLTAEKDSDVGAHPHIGLATVTYLFEGRQVHRDSLGTVQRIEPGAVNWMTAGRGIVHSERAVEEDQGHERPAHGLQLWVALPPHLETCDPAFQHVAAEDIPSLKLADGVAARLLVGQAWGQTSPVVTSSPTLYADFHIKADTSFKLAAIAEERALYGVESSWLLDGEVIQPNEMVVLEPGRTVQVASGDAPARVVLVGGAPLERPVRMWWNYVSTDITRIADAAKLWAADGFPRIAGEMDRVVGPQWVDRT
jgi:redox-sensitive bicupin YhaK (pirin superfamily)